MNRNAPNLHKIKNTFLIKNNVKSKYVETNRTFPTLILLRNDVKGTVAIIIQSLKYFQDIKYIYFYI